MESQFLLISEMLKRIGNRWVTLLRIKETKNYHLGVKRIWNLDTKRLIKLSQVIADSRKKTHQDLNSHSSTEPHHCNIWIPMFTLCLYCFSNNFTVNNFRLLLFGYLCLLTYITIFVLSASSIKYIWTYTHTHIWLA